MRIDTVHCHLLGAAVTRLVDFEGTVDRVICPSYQPWARTCRLKRAGATGGPLSRLLSRVHDETLGEHTGTCSLC